MTGIRVAVIAGAMAISVVGACSTATRGAAPDIEGPTIQIEDVALFYRIYDAAGGHPSAEQLQRDYIDAGTEGLRTFARVRNTTGARIWEAIANRPEIYADARRCADVLPRVRRRLDVALHNLHEVYPAANFPPVTIAVGRGRPVGVGSPTTGVQIGLEALCATDFLNPNVEDRFVYVIAHEFAHVQQAPELADGETPTVLEASLMEGAAEFIGEITAGSVAYSHLGAVTAGRELEIETAFAEAIESTDLSAWLYNTTADAPGDLGYWVGYRIVRSYYEHAADKRRAVREILQMTDARAFLVASRWRPGIEFDYAWRPMSSWPSPPMISSCVIAPSAISASLST